MNFVSILHQEKERKELFLNFRKNIGSSSLKDDLAAISWKMISRPKQTPYYEHITVLLVHSP